MDFTKKLESTLGEKKKSSDQEEAGEGDSGEGDKAGKDGEEGDLKVIELKPINQPFEVKKLASFSSKFYKPYQWAENVELEELQKALERPLSNKEFDVKVSFHYIYNSYNSFITLTVRVTNLTRLT